MTGLASMDCIRVGLVPAEHRRVAEHLGRGPRACNTPQRGQHHRQALVLARAGAGSKGQAPRGTHTTKEETVLGPAVFLLNPNPKALVRHRLSLLI